jgi:flagellar motility protein MotE (MotC chaperone)
MDEKKVENIVDNFKGMLWDDMADELNNMSREEMHAVILQLKKRFG